MSNYIPLFDVDVITYPYHNTNAGLGNLCQWKKIKRGKYVDEMSKNTYNRKVFSLN